MAHRQQLGIKDADLSGVKRMTGVALKTFQGLVDHLALPRAVAKAHHLRLLCRMGFAQLGAVADAVEMTYHSPAPAQTFSKIVQWSHHLIPAQGSGVREALLQRGFQRAELFSQVLNQCWDMSFYLGCIDGLEAWKALSAQEFWVGHRCQPAGSRVVRATRL